MKSVLARKDIELPRQQRLRANRTSFPCIDGYESILQLSDVLLDRLRSASRIVHFLFQVVDVG